MKNKKAIYKEYIKRDIKEANWSLNLKQELN